MTIEQLICDRVALAARALDKEQPGWSDRIDVDKLDLGDCKACILGQLHGDFYKAPMPDAEWHFAFSLSSVRDIPPEKNISDLWKHMTEMWKQEIAVREGAGNAHQVP